MTTHRTPEPTTAPATDAGSAGSHAAGGPRRSPWTIITGAFGIVAGLTPHVLHHIGPLVGTALVAGAGGTVLFGVLGLAASVPMLIKLRARFSSWWAPAIALGLFTAMFLISTLIIGPLISSGSGDVTSPVTSTDHAAHHHG